MQLVAIVLFAFSGYVVNASTVPPGDECAKKLMKCQDVAWENHKGNLMDYEDDKFCEKANGYSVLLRFMKCERDTYSRNFKAPTTSWNEDDYRLMLVKMEEREEDTSNAEVWSAYLKEISECAAEDQCFDRNAFVKIDEDCSAIWKECETGMIRDGENNKDFCPTVLWECEMDLWPKWEVKLMGSDSVECEGTDDDVEQEFFDCQYETYKKSFANDEPAWTEAVRPEFDTIMTAVHPEAKDNLDDWFAYLKSLTQCLNKKQCFDNKAFEQIDNCSKVWDKCAVEN